DQVVMGLAFVGVSAPQFVVGLLLIYLLAYLVPVFPLGGYGTPMHLVLPAVAVGLAGGGWYARVTRSATIDVLRQDFVRTARARGGFPGCVVLKHVLKNAVLPVVALVGLGIGVFMGGIVVVESVFGWPGIGQMIWQAIQLVDIPVIMGGVLITALFVVVGNLVADLVYPPLDPRIRYQQATTPARRAGCIASATTAPGGRHDGNGNQGEPQVTRPKARRGHAPRRGAPRRHAGGGGHRAAGRQGRRLVPGRRQHPRPGDRLRLAELVDHQVDVRRPDGLRARHDEPQAAPGRELHGLRRRPDLHVHAARGRQVPHRPRARRRGREVLARARARPRDAEPGPGLLPQHRGRPGVHRRAGRRGGRHPRGRRPHHRVHHLGARRRVPPQARPELRARRPAGGRRGRRRRLRPPAGRHGRVQAARVGARPAPRPRAQPRLLRGGRPLPRRA